MDAATFRATFDEIDQRLETLRGARQALVDLYHEQRARAARSRGAAYYWCHRDELLAKQRAKRRRDAG